MIKKILLFSFVFSFVACSDKEKEKLPDTILPVQKMEKVMLDIHLLEASLSLSITKSDKAPLLFQILKKHNITSEQYQENFAYYTQHLDSLNKIYELILIDLSEMQAEARAKKEPVQNIIRQQPVTK